MFALLGENKILCSDAAGYTTVYNATAGSFVGMPRRRLTPPRGPKHVAVSVRRTADHARADVRGELAVDAEVFAENPRGDHDDSVYVLDMARVVPDKPCSFDVLACYPVGSWRWRPLPPPPFLHDPGYRDPDKVAFAVVDDGTRICVSTAAATYSFGTVAREWSKAGDWVLPFQGEAEHVPELGLWLGISAGSGGLYDVCAVDLAAAAMGSPPAVVQHVRLDQDRDPPKNLVADKSNPGEPRIRQVLRRHVL
ncbi:hypothetical protein BAE44_0021642 [Dichanthelium oligosanthes]|uniref:DUF1618 domain-containing protein n=1 Tax=Dichanthelium oligosanthes TaxID=888268 RepID=A0A1E5UWX0_9POAL|nr:hypothetical protein BAE44_0021642 [Dichanthelium oligosanthes]